LLHKARVQTVPSAREAADPESAAPERRPFPAAPPPRRLRRFLGNVALVVASVAVTLLAAELALRVFGDDEGTLFVKDPAVGHRYVAGFAGRRFVPEAGRDVFLRFNRLGYRGPDRDPAKPAGTRRIAVLGDSFVASVGVEEADTMVAELETRLAAATGAHWEALNFGVSGYSTAQSLLTWRHVASRFAPDVVVLCFYVGNDPLDNSRKLSDFYRPYFDLAPDGTLVYRPMSVARASLNAWLAEHSQLYVWEKQKTRMLRDRLKRRRKSIVGVAVPTRTADVFDTRPSPDMAEAWAITEALLATLAREVTATGARFVLVAVPAFPEESDRAWQRLVTDVGPEKAARYDRDHPERWLARVAAAHGIPLVPLLPAFRAVPDPSALHLQEFHWSERGNRLAAETVAASLTGTAAP
jgi:lysophospholipase L1-like esterase